MKQVNREPISYYIGHLYRLGASYLTQKYAPYAMGFGQYQFLMQLYQQDGLSHEELTARLHVDKSTTTRAIEKLHKEQYVTIQQQENDKRKYRIYLTPAAREKQTEILQISAGWEGKMTACLSEEEKDVLYLLLKKIALFDAKDAQSH
ncbi:MAG: MarR family transcriptional regulator [Angelakisella sp.]